MSLLEILAERREGVSLPDAAAHLSVDERTVRRDAEVLQELLRIVGGIQVVRGRLQALPGLMEAAPRAGGAVGAKAAMAARAASHIPDGAAVVLTAGSSTLAVASELRRANIAEASPRDLIVFTNSLPALLELVQGGVSTGIVGEVYDPRDRAFHSHELRTRFQASLAVVGASGVVLDPTTGGISLCSDRMEEAAFMRQLLSSVPEVLVVAEAAKVGKRHPWSFTSDGLLVGKRICLVTTGLDRGQAELLASVAESARRSGITLSYEEVSGCAA